MSKRIIISALKKKGLAVETLDYDWQITPEEKVPAWDVVLTEDSEEAVLVACPDYDDWYRDFANTDDVLRWIETLPDCSALAAQESP